MGFEKERLEAKEIEELKELSKICKGDILKMTTLASSGHPGGSMSTLDILLILYKYANVFPDEPQKPDRDRIVVSHGHISPAVYSVLGRRGFFNVEEAIAHFRQAGSMFEGHIERKVPGVEWGTGNLGQGLSAGVGFAFASRINKIPYHVFVLMGDGEQSKGQIGEARRLAKKYNLTNITAIIDYNKLQLSGALAEIMPDNIREAYEADGWEVMETDGHDFEKLYKTIKEAISKNSPVAILAHTIMGKGVSFMENKYEYHGKALKEEQLEKALNELGIENDLSKYKKLRNGLIPTAEEPEIEIPEIKIGNSKVYTKEEKTDNRSAAGNALADLGRLNEKMAVVDCDLKSSVKTNSFEKERPENFIETGIEEHNAATVAGTLSISNILTYFADFGVFAVDETYNQQRLNDINRTNVKVISTHCGLDVGEDGKTHQAIDYIGVLRNLFDFKVIVPIDPNQTDKVIRYVAKEKGNFMVAVGRSKVSVITKEDGTPFFGEGYEFSYGKGDIIKEGKDLTIMALGQMTQKALKAYESLKEKGISVKVVGISSPLAISKEDLMEFASTGFIVTYEDHNVNTGLGSIVAEKLFEYKIPLKGFKKLGVTEYGPSGKADDVYRFMGLDEETLAEEILKLLS